MSDWISREAAIGALEDRRNKYLEDDPNWLQIQMDILTIRALPAVQPDADKLVTHMTGLIAAGLDCFKQYEEAYQYAFHLAKALRENYPPNPDFRFLGDLVGLLTQIDNMVAGLSQPDPREAALREALEAVNAKWRSGADTPDEMRGLALAEAAILDLIEGQQS